jgi:iron complex transport system substrate-binding protein
MTINRDHLIGDIIKTCGGEQLFAKEQLLVPTVSREAVAQANPDLIIAGVDNPQVKTDWSMWKNLKNLSATKNDAFYEIESDIISKPGPRVLLGAQKICQAVERTRQQKQNR